MQRIVLTSLVLLMALARPLPAQSPELQPQLVPFLEQRVTQELASEGIVLGRQHLALKIDQTDSRLTVSLLDTATRRVVVSTTIEPRSEDRDAVVASVTHVAAELAAKASRSARTPHVQEPSDAAILSRFLIARRAAEREYMRRAIRFGHRVEYQGHSMYHGRARRARNGSIEASEDGFHTGVATHRMGWPAIRGEHNTELEPAEFYAAVGRPELGASYTRRRRLALAGGVVGGASLIGGAALLIKSVRARAANDGRCEVWFQPESVAEYTRCEDNYEEVRAAEASRYGTPGKVLAGVGLAMVIAGGVLWKYQHPISESEAKGLADRHNRDLRRSLGLPVAGDPRPRIRDVQLAPYVGAGDVGITLGARF